jgi:delta24-sterol reductase
MEPHHKRVLTISKRVKHFHGHRKPFRIYHGSTNSTRESRYRHDNIVDTSKLNNVISIDSAKKVALVEPNVPMDDLVAATLPSGLVPPVVMEFPGITAGGGFSGTSGESSSFRYGFFDRIVNWVEIILPNGEVVTASSEDKSDLFRGSAASFGTLGVVTLLEVRLIDARKYVSLTYTQVSSMEQALQEVEAATSDESTDYIDGLVLAKNRIVLCTGRLTDGLESETQAQRFTRARDPWFFVHVSRRKSLSSGPVTEIIPLVDYLFRYDRGGFWVGTWAFKYFLTPFNRVTRYFLDRFMHTRVMYHALHQSGLSNQYIIQDVAVPYDAADEFLNWLHGNVDIYPLWLCPLRQRGQHSDSAHGLLAESSGSAGGGNGQLTNNDNNNNNANGEYLMNFGIWGPGPSSSNRNRQAFVAINRRLEQKVENLRGRKWLYAHTYYTEDEFWRLYNKKEYDALRAKYHAEYLPSIYDKVKVDYAVKEQTLTGWLVAFFWSIWPLMGLYGVYKAWRGGEYLLRKQNERLLEVDDGNKGD